MSIRESVYGIKKQAGAMDAIGQLLGNSIETVKQLGTTGSIYLLALSAASGIGLGYAAAKMNAHGKQDEDTAKKQYENERLKADLGYLNSKVLSEYNQYKNKVAPKPARVIA